MGHRAAFGASDSFAPVPSPKPPRKMPFRRKAYARPPHLPPFPRSNTMSPCSPVAALLLLTSQRPALLALPPAAGQSGSGLPVAPPVPARHPLHPRSSPRVAATHRAYPRCCHCHSPLLSLTRTKNGGGIQPGTLAAETVRRAVRQGWFGLAGLVSGLRGAPGDRTQPQVAASAPPACHPSSVTRRHQFLIRQLS